MSTVARKVLVILANFNPDTDIRSQVITNLGLNFIETCKLNGAQVDVIDLVTETNFNPFNLKTHQEQILEYQKRIRQADLLAFFHNTSWQYIPGLLKSFLDLVFSRGFAYKIEKRIVKGQLTDKRGVVFCTTESANWQVYLYGDLLRKGWKRVFFDYCGFRESQVHLFCNLRQVSDKKIEKWQNKVKSIANRLTKKSLLAEEILRIDYLDQI